MPRLDIRLDAERRRCLQELAEQRGVSISGLVRRLIDDAHESMARDRRKQAVRRLVSLEVEDPPSAATLSRESEAAHELPDLH